MRLIHTKTEEASKVYKFSDGADENIDDDNDVMYSDDDNRSIMDKTLPYTSP